MVLSGLIGIILIVTVGQLMISISQSRPLDAGIAVAGLVCFSALLLAHVRGWRYSPHMTVIVAVLFTIVSNPADLTLRQVSFTVLIPSVLAAMFLSSYWTIGAFAVCVVGIGLQSGFAGPLYRLDTFLIAIIVIAGTTFAGALARSLQYAAEERAELLEQKTQRIESQTTELAEANELLNVQLDQQNQLLELVSTLEVPVVRLADHVLFAPIVGHLDTRRTQALTQRLLESVHNLRASHIVLDLVGVTIVDTQVAQALIQTTKMLRLLGCNVILSGISASMAHTITNLGIQFDDIQTVRDPLEALNIVRISH
jgi:anti-anti-sigma regulatory factor